MSMQMNEWTKNETNSMTWPALKTERQTIQTENLMEKLKNWNQNSLLFWVNPELASSGSEQPSHNFCGLIRWNKYLINPWT